MSRAGRGRARLWLCKPRGLLQSLGVFLPGLALAQTAPDAQPGFHLSWVRAPEAVACVDATRVEADVERRLGWSPFTAGQGPNASIEAVVTRSAAVWKASIVMRGPSGADLGTREVQSESPTCDSLAKASALAIVLMIANAPVDLTDARRRSALEAGAKNRIAARAGGGGGSAPDDRQLTAASVSPAEVERRPEAARPREEREIVEGTGQVASESIGSAGSAGSAVEGRPEFGLAAGVVCMAGVLPRFACGPTLRTYIVLDRRLLTSVTVSVLPEQTLARSGARVGFGLTAAALGGCYRLVLAQSWSVSPCAALLLGALYVTVENPTPVTAGQRWWWAGSLGLHFTWQVGALELQGGVEALALLARRDYVVERADPPGTVSLYTEEPLGALSALGAGVHF